MTDNRRLDTWKEVGFFLGRNERTAKRWELERGLPIHRVPGGPRGRIYAYSNELKAWLENVPTDTVVSENLTSTPQGEGATPMGGVVGHAGGSRSTLLSLGIVAILAFLATAYLTTSPVSAGPRPPSKMDRVGDYEWSRRTPESLARAVDAYTQAVVADPGDARAFAGLARCYILLREFSSMPDGIAYPKAEAAARRAIALDDRLADAHASLGFVEFYSSWKFADGQHEFQRAIEIDPGNGTWRQWYANALSTRGDFRAAKLEIDRAQELNPSSASLMADRARIYFMLGNRIEAFALLRTLEQNEPNLTSSHTYMADFLQEIGDERGYLRELKSAAESRGDANALEIARAGSRGFASGGRHGMYSAIIAKRQALLQMGKGDQFRLAESYAAIGDASHAVAALQQSLRKREATLLGVKTENIFRSIEADPKYISVVKAVGL